ncbi:ecotropic viral integration site, variant 2 [Schistosoma haematobium]|uniref:Ecotropic viral integration site, variant 2 n=1 Tax=Schistosoma haematobium TaxID=6185 RepID=A0A922S4C6_SCHHA|nr:ecotropic viral integration site, variant 2 [Schistosoma haematobium]KAH9592822.1 ecotropic viral integration site, variant 2 [Schistosoma haematobium]
MLKSFHLYILVDEKVLYQVAFPLDLGRMIHEYLFCPLILGNGTSSLQLNGHATHGSSKSSNTSGVSIPLMIGWTAGAPISSSIREQWDYVINNWDQCSKKKSYVSVGC